MNPGLYEELISQLIAKNLANLDREFYYIQEIQVDRVEATQVLSRYLSEIIRRALGLLTGPTSLVEQIELANKIIRLLQSECHESAFTDDLIEAGGRILRAILPKLDFDHIDFEQYVKDITPYTRLTHSELFTGGNGSVTLVSELKKEILSSDRIDLLISFIKWKGFVLLEKELIKFTDRGGQLRVVTTTYMGATDSKAIQKLSTLKNTEVKISYNNGNERLHAKAYLFYRNSGFHTGYIGSSNLSHAALTEGLEWNLKVTTKEVGHIIDKFQKTFESYWQSSDYETFDSATQTERLNEALNQGAQPKSNSFVHYFDIHPFPFQNEILEKLQVERTLHGRWKNLVVAATGTGKTIISAFDFKRYLQSNSSAKFLYVAHRKEILEQAMLKYRGVLKDSNFGELWVDGIEPARLNQIFASVQTLNNRLDSLSLSAEYYDFIVIDEVHHVSAKSYRAILEKFNPKILLGLTATPERGDGGDVLSDFGGRIAAEIRLPEALNRGFLCPFQYYGISDVVDLSNVRWVKGRYQKSELTNLYMENDARVSHILHSLSLYLKDPCSVRALAFCVGIEHARYMAEKFIQAGMKAAYLASDETKNRDQLRDQLKKGEINYLFVVDIFNEGVDIPEIDTVLFLRPTESLTIFLQQFGRGLRVAPPKEYLAVLDFVGNSRPEYNFEDRFRALMGKTNSSVAKEIQDDFPHLPPGCSIVLEEKAKEIILRNIESATSFGEKRMIRCIQDYHNHTDRLLSLESFLDVYQLPIQSVYRKGNGVGWNRLLAKANRRAEFSAPNELELTKAISNKWLSTLSSSYFFFILELADNSFHVRLDQLNDVERAMCLMLYYDVWGKPGRFASLQESIHAIGKNPEMVTEIKEVIRYQLNRIDFIEMDVELPFVQPLKVHARYTRDQIFAAFGFHSFISRSSNIEGVAENKSLNVELLFIDLHKSEEDYSPTTMYDDYAISDKLFHWQSQNATHSKSPKGLSYIEHMKTGKRILKFVRERSTNEFGGTIGYVFLGEAAFVSTSGDKPMNITWELKTPIPNYLWIESAKLSVG